MVSYGIFIIQFFLSLFGGDTDVDIDLDGDADFDTGSLFSFKGLVHFAMGFSGWLMLAREVNPFTVCIAVMAGIAFMVILYYLYKLCMQFHSEPTEKSGIELVGCTVSVVAILQDGTCLCSPINQLYRELRCYSKSPVKVGDLRTIGSYHNGTYEIL